LSRDMLCEVAGEETRGQVIVVASLVPDDHSDLSLVVEVGWRLCVRAEGETYHRNASKCAPSHACIHASRRVLLALLSMRSSSLGARVASVSKDGLAVSRRRGMTAESSFRRALLHEGRRCAIVAFLAG